MLKYQANNTLSTNHIFINLIGMTDGHSVKMLDLILKRIQEELISGVVKSNNGSHDYIFKVMT